MNSVIVYLAPDVPLHRISERLRSAESAVDGERIYWHLVESPDGYGDPVPPFELFNRVASERWLQVVIDYSGGLELVKHVVERLVSGFAAVVDNDHGDLMTAEEFVGRLRDCPGWDWRS